MGSIFDTGGYVGYDPTFQTFNPEEGLSLTNSFAQSNRIDDLLFARNLDVTFACEITFPAAFNSDGILFKLGGNAIGGGVALINSGQTLRFLSSDGAASPDLSITAIVDIPTSNFDPLASGTLVWDFRINPGRVRAWWNGELLGESSTSGGGPLEGSVWAGTNDASYVLAPAADGPDSLITGTNPAWPGTAQSNLRYYSNQLVSEPKSISGIWSLNASLLGDNYVKW